ncbi:hypothetical protein [Parabacteroides sp. PF5-9]|uniref:hypothetical protein n=1 Tax=Parabacteroides sp. PF5-9 TaxID=1742404 RepID=UPI0024771315|nr:hypothetical protein [Parabacteroides sp. PF5-9]MDH6358061.1 CHASE2 domain-containing sensor protein [Parabacteroides sp. PF5-9]
MEEIMTTTESPTSAPAPTSKEISLGEWIITLLLLCIPFLNFIMLFVWAFGGGTTATKANFAKAVLLWMVIGIVLSMMFLSSFIAALGGLVGFSDLLAV